MMASCGEIQCEGLSFMSQQARIISSHGGLGSMVRVSFVPAPPEGRNSSNATGHFKAQSRELRAGDAVEPKTREDWQELKVNSRGMWSFLLCLRSAVPLY